MLRKLLSIMILGLTVLSPFSWPTALAAESQTVILDVPGMTCKLCPITIRKALERVPGVIEAKSDYESMSATVVFDPAKTDAAALTAATADAGYPSTLRQPRMTGTEDE